MKLIGLKSTSNRTQLESNKRQNNEIIKDINTEYEIAKNNQIKRNKRCSKGNLKV
jgi:hypothetical protein